MNKKENKNIIKDESIKIWESNTLAVAPINEILEPNSIKLFLWSIFQATDQKNINKDGQLEAEFELKKFAEYFNINPKNSYSFAKKWTDKIQNYKYYLKDNPEDEEFQAEVAIPSVKYKNGVVTTIFSNKITNHLLDLKDNKIFIELNHLRKIKNPRFIKLYEYFKAKVYDGQINRIVNIKLDNLKKLLVVLNKTYSRFYNFKSRVLLPVIKEFDKINDIKIENWELLKKGGEVSGVRFWVSNLSHDVIKKEQKKINNLNKKCKKDNCSGWLIPKKGSDNWYYACNEYPDCINTISIKNKDTILNLEKQNIESNNKQKYSNKIKYQSDIDKKQIKSKQKTNKNIVTFEEDDILWE